MIRNNAQEAFPMPGIGNPAPEFEALSTHGKVSFPGDYKGKWTILFSQPKPSTPRCNKKTDDFDNLKKQFSEVNCELIELLVDGNYTPVAWLQNLEEDIAYETMKDIKISSPSVKTIPTRVAQKYGITQDIENDTIKAKTIFFINPKGIIKTIIHHPTGLERNFDNLLKLELALQSAEKCENKTLQNPHNHELKNNSNFTYGSPIKDKTKHTKQDCKFWFH